MRRVGFALSTIPLLALASGCGQMMSSNQPASPPPVASGTSVPAVPTTPGVLQGSPGYTSASGQTLLADNSSFDVPAYDVHRDAMGGRLVASNSAVYSNRLLMTQPNLYERYDVAPGFRAQALSHAQAMAGSTTPPAQQAVEQRQNVYFNWDKSVLTPGGDKVVQVLAQQLRNDPAVTLVLVGKADLSGTDHYNLGLSERRAQTVRERFVAAGVAPERIQTRWVGDREPPVPTARGVREARNRVVAMTLATMSGGGTAPQPSVALGRRVLYTTTEGFPPGANGTELPGLVANGSMSGAAAATQ